MSTLMKWLVMLLIWLLFSLFAFRSCIKDACCEACVRTETEQVAPPPAETSITRYPVESTLGISDVTTSPKFGAWKNQLMADLEEGKILEIEGLYYGSEPIPEDEPNMGMVRAKQAIEHLSAFIPRDKMRPISRLIDGDAPTNSAKFMAADAHWVNDDSLAENIAKTEVVQLNADEQIILFPKASDREVEEEEVLAYLDNLASYLNDNESASVEITGHASKVGKASQNMRLSRKRAERVAAMLYARGVSKTQVTIDYKGDTQLRDVGDSASANRRNRRAHLKVIRP